MQEIYFMARHTPFWAIPIMVLSAEFAYVFWLRKKKSTVVLCMVIFSLGLFATSFYIWAGGPEKSVKILKKMHRDHFHKSQN
jgi:hypothetical protein